MTEPKVTECWATLNEDGSPDVNYTIWMIDPKSQDFNRVIAVIAEDYDRLLEGYRMLFEVMDDEYNMDDGDLIAEIEKRLEAKRGK